MAELKDCPESVILGGAALVNLRHKLEDLDGLFLDAINAVEATQKDLKAAGLKRMSYGVALANLKQAWGASGLVMAAHEHMARGLTDIGMKQPSDAQLLPHLKDLRDWR